MIGGVFFVAYLLTRTRDLGGDDTVFAMAVDSLLSGGGPSREVFHPHHALFNPLVAAVCRVLRLAGLHPFVTDVGAARAALFAAAVAGGLVPVLRRAGVGEGPALLAAAVAGASGGLWQYGTCMEVYALAAATVLLWLAVVGAPALNRCPWVFRLPPRCSVTSRRVSCSCRPRLASESGRPRWRPRLPSVWAWPPSC